MSRAAFVTALTLSLSAMFSGGAVAIADTSSDRGDIVELQTNEAAVAEVLVLHATNSGKGIDDKLKHLKKDLQKPPLSSYDSYEQLAQESRGLELKTPATVSLPNEGKLSLTLNEVIPREGKKPKFDVDVKVDDKDGNQFVFTNVKAPASKYFYVAGPPYTKDGFEGILVFAIRLDEP
jgi:hypothetical protein